MGLGEFYTEQRGKNPAEAFAKAVDTARKAHGDGGHTGSIAEKSDFVVIEDSVSVVQEKMTERIQECANQEASARRDNPDDARRISSERRALRRERTMFTTRPKRSGRDKALAIAYALITMQDDRINLADKPAGAIQYIKNHWLFFGMAEE